MFGNLGCHVIDFPSGRWGFVGSVPQSLCEDRDATTADVMGCRSHRREDGTLGCWRPRVFETEAAARAFAAEKGVTLSN